MQQGGGRIGENDFGVIALPPAQGFQPRDFINGQFAEQAQKTPDIGIIRIAPVLPILPGRRHLRIQPQGTGCGLAHLAPIRGCDEGGGQAIQVATVGLARQFHAIDDIAPLVGAAHLQHTIMAARQFEKVKSLKHHIVEFQKTQRLLPLHAQFDRIEPQHAIDGKMPPVVAQKINANKPVQPLLVVHQQCAVRRITEAQKTPKTPLDAADVRLDALGIHEAAAFLLAGRITDAGGGPPQQHDGAMSAVLQPPQHHDGKQIADMQGRRGAVKPHIGGDAPLGGEGVQPLGIGALMDVSALLEQAQKRRTRLGISGHGRRIARQRRVWRGYASFRGVLFCPAAGAHWRATAVFRRGALPPAPPEGTHYRAMPGTC